MNARKPTSGKLSGRVIQAVYSTDTNCFRAKTLDSGRTNIECLPGKSATSSLKGHQLREIAFSFWENNRIVDFTILRKGEGHEFPVLDED